MMIPPRAWPAFVYWRLKAIFDFLDSGASSFKAIALICCLEGAIVMGLVFLLSIVLSHRLLPHSKPQALLLLSAAALAIATYNGHLERRGYFTQFDDRFERLGARARAIHTAVVVASIVSCFGATLYLADRASKLPW